MPSADDYLQGVPDQPRPRFGPRRAVLVAAGVSALVAAITAGLSGPGSTPQTGLGLAASTTRATAQTVHTHDARARAVDCRRLKCIALTFDDGPGPTTEQLLKILRGAHAHATFFMIGIQVQQFPRVARDVVRAGDEVGDHTWDHPDLDTLSPQRVRWEIAKARTEIIHATGVAPRFLRPPYGSTGPMVGSVAGSLGLPQVLWDVDTQDWLFRDQARVRTNAVSAAFPGAIILMHDIYPSTVAAVPGIIKQLRAEGYTLVTVSQLVGQMRPGTEYFGHTTGRTF